MFHFFFVDRHSDAFAMNSGTAYLLFWSNISAAKGGNKVSTELPFLSIQRR